MTVREYLRKHGPPVHGEIPALAAQLGVTPGHVRCVMHEVGLRCQTRTDAIADAFARLGIETLPWGALPALARELGVHEETVRRAVMRSGVTIERRKR